MKETILIVDDEPEIVQLLSDILTSEGYRTICATGALEAMEIFKNESIDLTITDIRMPGMNGIEFIREIKKLDEDQQILVLTGFASVDNAVSVLRNGGAFDYFAKPLEDIDLFLLAVSKALEKGSLLALSNRLRKELEVHQIELKMQNEELRRVQSELQSSKDSYSHLYDFSPVAYFSIGEKGAIAKVNLTGAAMIGAERARLMGRPFTRFIHGDDQDTWHHHQRRLFEGAGAPMACRLWMLREDGREFYVHMECMALRDKNGHMVEIRVAASDITETKRIEDALERSEEKYRDIVEGTNDLITRMDGEGRLVYVNHVAKRVFGLPAEECVGRSAFDFIHPDDRVRMKKEFLEWMNSASPLSTTVENRQVNQDTGEVHEMRWTCTLKGDEKGNMNAVDSIGHDVTERRELEEMRLKTKKLESLGVLAGGIAHDFNNLLSVIMGYISLAEFDVKPEIGSSEKLKSAEKTCMRAKDLTSRLITFSKGGEPVRKASRIGRLLKDSVASAPGCRHLNVKFSIPEDLWFVDIDENQIRQVFHNIAANAEEAMEGKGQLEVCCQNVDMTEKAPLDLKNKKYVKISFKDQGVGIPEGNLQRIFDPYFSTKDMGAHKGSGLGLAVCHSIISKHDGRITVKSEPGMGTTFAVYLPAWEKRVAAPSVKKTAGKSPVTGGGKILLMDDEPMIRETAALLLIRMGYEVQVCGDGAEAVEIYKNAMASGEPFDVVILDLTINGGMGGVDAIQGLLNIDPGVKGIVSTGYSNDPAVTHFREYGFCGVLAKPYRVGDLKEILRDVMG